MNKNVNQKCKEIVCSFLAMRISKNKTNLKLSSRHVWARQAKNRTGVYTSHGLGRKRIRVSVPSGPEREVTEDEKKREGAKGRGQG